MKKVGAVAVEQKEDKPKPKAQTSMMDILKDSIKMRFQQLHKHEEDQEGEEEEEEDW